MKRNLIPAQHIATHAHQPHAQAIHSRIQFFRFMMERMF